MTDNEKNNVIITLITNNERDNILGIIVNGKEFYREEGQKYSRFLAETTYNLREKENIDIYPYLMNNSYNNVTAIKKENYERLKEKEAEKQVLKKTESSKKLRNKIAATAIAAILAITTFGVMGCTNNTKDTTAKENIKTEEPAEEQLSAKTSEELINMLDKSGQKQAFEKIVAFQNYFNNEAAPSIKRPEDKEAQLYLTFDEAAATYLYLNANNLSADKLAEFFGKGKIVWLNENTGEYETLTKEKISEKYLNAMQVLNYYYTRATTTAGISLLAENKGEAQFFNEFETLLLNYNKNPNKSQAEKIKQRLTEIYISSDIDPLYEKYQGASSVIGTGMEPTIYAKGIISNKFHKTIIERNENITCDYIYNKIGNIVLKLNKNGKEKVLNILAKLQNKDLKNRNINLTNSLEGYRYKDLNFNINLYNQGFVRKNSTTKHSSKKTTNRDEAMRANKKDTLNGEKKEQKKIREKNKREEKRAKDKQRGNNDAVDDFIKNKGKKGTPNKNESDNYKDQYNKTNKDLEEVQKQQDKYDDTHPETWTEVVEEKTYDNNGKEIKSNSQTKTVQKVKSVVTTEGVEYNVETPEKENVKTR